MLNLDGKVVLVTGAAGLIGRSFIRALAQQSAIPIIADIDPKAIDDFKTELHREGRKQAEGIELDITSKESLSKAIAHLHTRHGRIDALVNSAYPRNRNYGRKFFDVEFEDFCENLSLNIGGYFLASQQFAQYFQTQGHGNIINISSVYGVVAPRFGIYHNTPMTMPVEYAAIKSSLIHLTRYMAKYLKGSNVRVNTISPGGILDGQAENFCAGYRQHCLSKGMLDAQDLNGTLLFLLSDMSKYINGQNLIVDDGFTL